MKPRVSIAHQSSFAVALAACLVFVATQAVAFPGVLQDWQARYGATSPSGDNAQCQLCHVDANGGDPWNGYGWDIGGALNDPLCDFNGNGDVSTNEAFFCVELLNSDNDGSGVDNVTEIGLGTQPGWTDGAFNTYYFRSGQTLTNQLPPTDIGPLDPDGTEPPPPPPPPPPGDDEDLPPGQLVRDTIVVRPGESIQAAIDRAEEGTRIFVLAGVYREIGNPTNGLNITKSGIRLIGQTTPNKRVIIENAGNQRNGIVVVPPAEKDCMSCHESMAPPFPLLDGVGPRPEDMEPLLYDIEIRGITIRGFDNNGLFTQRVDGYKIIDVESVDNRNYGIFPTLSRNGLITHSRATGSDLDSGIWVQSSENVLVTHNVAEDNVNGFEISNSDDVEVVHNVTRQNTVGMSILMLPGGEFDERQGANRINLRDNVVVDNNRDNTSRPGSALSNLPPGIGIFYQAVDNSLITRNHVEDNHFSGVAIVDYCLSVAGTPQQCCTAPGQQDCDANTLKPGFLPDQSAVNNRVVQNVLINNGTQPVQHPFAFAAADLTLITLPDDHGNCYEDNSNFATFFSLLELLSGNPPPWTPPSCP
jgi:parallel beta-helix repeat protein